MEEMLIPLMFYGIVSFVYLAVAAIGFLVTFFAFRVHRLISEKSVRNLSISFFILSIGFIVLTAISIFTYVQIQYYNSYSGIVFYNYYGFSIYYWLSLAAYILLAFTYLPKIKKGKKIIPVLFVPLWYVDYTQFHLVSLLLIGFVIFRSLQNSLKRKNLDSYLVTFAFACLAAFHALILLTTFTPFMYVVANSFLIVGFVSLLAMLVRVYRR
jgi:glucan phosphoethanolaminetransferase (alkaline phosphatase superfamily)